MIAPPDRGARIRCRHRDGDPDCDCWPECPDCGETYDPHDGHRCADEPEEESARQASAGKATPDGPWRLERWQVGEDGKVRVVVLPNSVRSTYSEAKRLSDDECARTDIRCGIARCPE